MPERVPGVPGPAVYADYYALIFKFVTLTRLDSHFGYTFFGRHEQMPGGVRQIAHLQNATVRTPIALYDADDTARGKLI